MICPNCGRELPDTARVCPGCNAVQRAYRRRQAEADVDWKDRARMWRAGNARSRTRAQERTDESTEYRHGIPPRNGFPRAEKRTHKRDREQGAHRAGKTESLRTGKGAACPPRAGQPAAKGRCKAGDHESADLPAVAQEAAPHHGAYSAAAALRRFGGGLHAAENRKRPAADGCSGDGASPERTPTLRWARSCWIRRITPAPFKRCKSRLTASRKTSMRSF